MKKTSNSLILAVFLALISQGIKAQFDDVYYDPDRFKYRDKEETVWPKEKSRTKPEGLAQEDEYDTSENYDDDDNEWEDQDYYYTSKLKRFHRPYRGFDYYDPCYVDYYYYDPFDYNPWYSEYDIYISNWGYHNYNRWRNWNSYSWHYSPYWSHWDWYFGWSSCPVSYSYYYWPGSYYSNYYNYGSYGGHHYSNHYNYGGNHGKGHHYDNHPNGQYFGSRNFGLTNTSKRGPVRVNKPSPKIIKELPGSSPDQKPNQGPKRIIRSSDGDRYHPEQPKSNPDRTNPRIEKDRAQPHTPEKGSEKSEKFNPRKHSGYQNNSDGLEPTTGTTGREERYTNPEYSDKVRSDFKPKRVHRDEIPSDIKPKFEMPGSSNQETNRPSRHQMNESRPEPTRTSGSDFSGSKSNPSRSENSKNSNGGGRKSPR